MNADSLVVTVGLVLLAAPALSANPAAKGADSLAAAQKKLTVARDELSRAVKRVEVDPPAQADLEAAQKAVEALKDAIDFGVDFEAKDLDYAKLALTARKELRTQREYVDQRRANVHVHEQRRAIDAAVATMTATVKKTEAKGASAKDFEDARAAIAAVKKALVEGRKYAKDDSKFAGFLGQTDTAATQAEKAIDDRWTLQEVDKHRPRLEESRKALATVLAELAKGGATDAQFEAADKAATELGKRLDEGKVFEPRNKPYQTDAEKARAELAQAKKRIEELLNSTSLERLKAEIEPSRKDLVAALRVLRGKKPTDEQLAEARTVATVVAKLVEKFQPQAARSQAFGKYVDDVKKILSDVELELSRRNLEGARTAVATAMRALEKPNPPDESFAEVNAALSFLEKTLESVGKRPDLAPFIADAQGSLRDGKATWAKRRLEVDVLRQRTKVQDARNAAEALVKQVQGPEATSAQLDEAEKLVKQVRTVLDEGVELTKKYRDYTDFDRATRERLVDLSGRIANRRITLAASVAKGQLNEAMLDGKSRLETVKKPEATDADLDAAVKSVEALSKLTDSNPELEKQDKGYAASLDKARLELMRQMEALEAAKISRQVRKETGEALTAGASAIEGATQAKDRHKQKELYDKALARFRSCEKEGGKLMQNFPQLTKLPVLADGRLSTPPDVINDCAERAKTTEPILRETMALITFDDGPKKTYEAGVNLLAKGKKAEALAQFNECIYAGQVGRNKYPELKDRTFQVAGAPMTIAEIIDKCGNQRKALMGK